MEESQELMRMCVPATAAIPPLLAGGGPITIVGGATGGGTTDSAALVAALNQLTQALGALAQALAGAGAVAGVSGGGAAMPTQTSPVQVPTQAAPVTAATAAPPQRGGAQDGPNVARKILSKETLEQDPLLRGKLDPPTSGKPPKGVKVRTRPDGTRVLSINIHNAVPKGKALTDANERISAMRDVAAYVNAADADVVMVQEINDDPFTPNGSGIDKQTSVMAHLLGATDMAYTPGTGTKTKQRRGTAIFTRNGYTIPKAVNVDLVDKRPYGSRSAGVALVQPPNGREAFSVISTHLSHRPDQTASDLRNAQLREVARVANAIQSGGSFNYRTPGSDKRHSASGFAQSRVVLGGDLNTTRRGRNHNDSADELLGAAKLRHAWQLSGSGRWGGIDHVYAHGFQSSYAHGGTIKPKELQSGMPTDHPAIITDLY